MGPSQPKAIDIQGGLLTESSSPNIPPILDVAVKFLDFWQFVFQHFQVHIGAKGMVDAREDDKQSDLAV